jgi:4-hydroxybenzoate polyprenyltransferase
MDVMARSSMLLSRPRWALVAVSRPWFWPVSWVPAYVGTVLAEGTWLPAAQHVSRSLVALLILGPLVWGAVLAQNDLHDLASDRVNPRKADAPLVCGSIEPQRLALWYRLLVLSAVGTALFVGPMFALGVAGVLAIGWAYSAPPLRLKTRPGADVAVNAFVVGVVSPAAGWSITRAPWEFPWQIGLIGFLFTAALYLPTTVTDLKADLGAGDTTFAVRYGVRFTYRLGVGLWLGALGFALVCALLDAVVPHSTWPYQAAMAPILLVAYAVLTRRPSISRLAVVSMLFAIPTVGFVVAYVAAGQTY